MTTLLTRQIPTPHVQKPVFQTPYQLYPKLPAENVEQACSGIRNRTVESLCTNRFALCGVVLTKVAIECSGLVCELRANVAADNRDASNSDENRKDPEYVRCGDFETRWMLTWGRQWAWSWEQPFLWIDVIGGLCKWAEAEDASVVGEKISVIVVVIDGDEKNYLRVKNSVIIYSRLEVHFVQFRNHFLRSHVDVLSWRVVLFLVVP